MCQTINGECSSGVVGLMRNLLILAILLFQLSFTELLSRALAQVRARVSAVVVSVDMPRVSEGRLLPPSTPQLPCAIGLSIPPVFVCPTPTPPANGD